MNTAREVAYRVNPALWMQEVLGITPHDWQKTFLLAPRGASIAVLTARQVGKTTAAAVGMAHSAVFMPGSLSVVACPSQNQSAEALRKVRDMVLMAGAELTTGTMSTGSSLPTVRAYWRCLALRSQSEVSLSMPGSLPMKRPNWIQLLWQPCIRCGPSVPMRVSRCCRRHGAAPIHSGRFGKTTIRPGRVSVRR